LHVVIIAKTNLHTQARAHVVLFSSDLDLAYAPLVDYYGLRFTTWRVIAYEGEIEEDREKRPGLSRVTSVSSPRAIAGCCQLSGSPEKALMPDGQSCLDSL